MKVKNDTGKDLIIAFGSNIENLIVGKLSAGKTDDLPIEPTDFLNILSIEK